MSGLFEHLAATDDSARVANRKTIAVANKRVSDFLGDFLKRASSEEERNARIALVEEDIQRIVADVTDEYGGDPQHALSAIREVLGCDESENDDDDDDDDDWDPSESESSKGKKKKAAGPLGAPGLPSTSPAAPSANCPTCGQAMGPDGTCPTCNPSAPIPGDNPILSPQPDSHALPGGLPLQASVHEARRPKMCPYHSELVDASLQAGSPQYGAYSGLVGGPSHCKGGFDGSCNFKPDMVTQTYWDKKEDEYADRRRQRELERAQPEPINTIPEPDMPIGGDEGDGITDINTELSEAPSAVGDGVSEHFQDEPAMAMAASQHTAVGVPGIGAPIDPAELARMQQGGPPGPAGQPGPAYGPAQGGDAMAPAIPPPPHGIQQGLHPGMQPGLGQQPPQAPPPEEVFPGMPPTSLLASQRQADAPRDGGGAVTTEELKPNQNDMGVRGPSPEIDKTTWKPNALNENGNLDPIDTEMSGSPHADDTQDVSDTPEYKYQDQETWPPSTTDSVTDHQDLPSANDDGQTGDRNIDQPHTDTWGEDGQADAITRANPEAVISAAQDPDKNPIREVLTSGSEWPTEAEISQAIASYRAQG